jgi:hypothetical protein
MNTKNLLQTKLAFVPTNCTKLVQTFLIVRILCCKNDIEWIEEIVEEVGTSLSSHINVIFFFYLNISIYSYFYKWIIMFDRFRTMSFGLTFVWCLKRLIAIDPRIAFIIGEWLSVYSNMTQMINYILKFVIAVRAKFCINSHYIFLCMSNPGRNALWKWYK